MKKKWAILGVILVTHGWDSFALEEVSKAGASPAAISSNTATSKGITVLVLAKLSALYQELQLFQEIFMGLPSPQKLNLKAYFQAVPEAIDTLIEHRVVVVEENFKKIKDSTIGDEEVATFRGNFERLKGALTRYLAAEVVGAPSGLKRGALDYAKEISDLAKEILENGQLDKPIS